MRPPSSDAGRLAATSTPTGGSVPYTCSAEGVRLRVQVTTRARAERLTGVVAAGRQPRLRISVSAPPHDGAANAAVIALLARSLRLPKSSLSIVAGAGHREKTIAILGDGAAIAAGIDAYVAAAAGERR